jgi:hypothetical protein
MSADCPDAGDRVPVEHAAMPRQDVPRIVIAGGTVAGLEACLSLRPGGEGVAVSVDVRTAASGVPTDGARAARP